MLYVGTNIKVIDNSGARLGKCLKILGKSHKSRGKVGDIIVVSIKKVIPNKRVKKGDIFKSVIVRIKFCIYRYGGIYVSFSSNGIVLLNAKFTVLGTRILSAVSRELRQKNFSRIVSLSPIVI